MAFEQTFSAYERKDLEIATKDELIDLVIAGQEEAVAIRKSKEDTLAMTLGLVVAGPFIFLLVLLVLESIGMPKMAAEICSLVLTIGLIIAWFIRFGASGGVVWRHGWRIHWPIILSGLLNCVLSCSSRCDEAWWLGINFDKDWPGQIPPARAPASSQIIGIRIGFLAPYLTGGRPNLWVHPGQSLRHTPTATPAAKIFFVSLIFIRMKKRSDPCAFWPL